MELCWSCQAVVEPGRSHCKVCDSPVRHPEDPTMVSPPATPWRPPSGDGGQAALPAYPETGPPPPPSYGQPPYGQPSYPPAPYQAPVYAQPPYPQPTYVQPVYGVPTYAVPVPVAVAAPPKSKAAAALLCFFLGGLGIHRFYTGQVGLGLALLLTSLILGPLTLGLWYVVTFVWVIIDFVLILSGGVSDQYGRPLT